MHAKFFPYDPDYPGKWMVGSWRGQGAVGSYASDAWSTQEVWTQVLAGELIGMFRMVYFAEPRVYEFMRLKTSPEGPLVMEITHFNGDGTIWPNQPVVFHSIEIGDDRIAYEQDGVPGKTLIYEQTGKNTMRITLNDPEDAAPSVFEFRRAK